MKTQRILALDGIRAVAIAGVLAMHLKAILPGGHLGVSVFFVLSGYIITKSLLVERERSGRIDFKAFYIRRTARLAPPLAVAIGAAMALALLKGASLLGTLAGGGAALLYVTNLVRTFFGNGYLGGYGWAWTLALEEQFYLVWPILLLFTWKRSIKWSLIVAALGVVGPFLLRFVLPTLADPVPAQLYYGPHSRVSGLMLGCVLAIVLHIRPFVWKQATASIVSVASLALIGASFCFANAAETSTYTLWMPLVELTSATLILSVLSAPGSLPARALSLRPLAYVGLISYGVYLWNAVILDNLIYPLGLPDVPAGALWLILTIGISALSFRFMEEPTREKVRAYLKARNEPDASLVPEPGVVGLRH